MRKIKRKRKDWRNDLVTALTLRLGRVSLACQRRGGGTPAAAKDTRFTPRHAQERELRRARRQRECPASHRENRLPHVRFSPPVNCRFSPGNLGRIDSGAAQHRRRRGLTREANPPRKPEVVRTLHLRELGRECSRRPEKTPHLVAGIRPVPASTVLNPPSVSSATRQLFINP